VAPSSSALASSDTGPSDRVDAAADGPVADALNGPTVATTAVEAPRDTPSEAAAAEDSGAAVSPTEDTPAEGTAAGANPAEDIPAEDTPAEASPSDNGDATHEQPAAGTDETRAEGATVTIPTTPEGPRGRLRLLSRGLLPRRLLPRRPWLRRTAAALAVVVVVLAAVAAPSLVHALTRPGSDSVAARLAEWGRDHGLGPVVTWLEARQYDLDQPPTGGAPPGGIPHVPGAVADHPGGIPAPPPLPAPAGLPPLPGEGQWQPVVSTPHGDAVRMTTVRPDAAHTSFLVGVLWMDPTLVRGVLHPGTEDPGGDWSVPPSVDPTEQRTVVSAFSVGFRLQGDSHGGWYLDGREARPLVPGAASLVIHRDGSADVGAWGSEVRMTPDVAAVRQNLIPLVDHGVVDPTCATGGTAEWGSTVGQAAYINRSAFGVTATGAEIYVGGPALSVCTLGDILRSAGAVRGMELDINPAWVSGAYFHPTGQPRPDAFQLFPGEQVGAQHYLQTSSRDFVSFDLRSVADTAGALPSSQHHGGKHPPSPSGTKHHP
jgi:hypothetical protein